MTYISIIFIGVWINIIRKEIQRTKMGEIIVLLPKRKFEYISILLGVLFLLIKYIRYKQQSSYINSEGVIQTYSIYILLALGTITVPAFFIYQGIRKYQIKENGLWTPQQVVYWSQVHSYQIIDYKQFNKSYEGKDYKLKLKVTHSFFNKTWYKDFELDIPQDKVTTVENLLKSKLNMET